jgi:hypothetical protein|tara:strand:+ start:400 stop:600 length:201 start_codon:yes stop_codon:yes gene_type:complete
MTKEKFKWPDYYNYSKPEFMDKKEKKEKECMMCNKNFMSEGNYNRVCDNCKLSHDWKYGNDYGFVK